tara:strand:- start:600 stop:1154 length:555 start_codon:yes stop_codon:yes gene_type:complete
MELQEWVSGSFQETDTDYKIAGRNILYKNEEDFLVKGVELLCDKLNPTSVLEFGFGKGWTATEFQRKGVTRHVILEPNIENYQMALTWKSNYSTNIDILNIWSWDYTGGETFNLVYDDREPVTSNDGDNHFTKMAEIFPSNQWYARNAGVLTTDINNFQGDSFSFTLNGTTYIQHLIKGLYGNG